MPVMRDRTTTLWMGTLLLAALGALVSACGPQDGAPVKPQGVAMPNKPATKSASGKTTEFRTADAKPVQAAQAKPAPPPSDTTGAVQKIDTLTEVVGYRVQVHLDNGQLRTFEPTQLDGLKVGDRVRVEQGHLRRV